MELSTEPGRFLAQDGCSQCHSPAELHVVEGTSSGAISASFIRFGARAGLRKKIFDTSQARYVGSHPRWMMIRLVSWVVLMLASANAVAYAEFLAADAEPARERQAGAPVRVAPPPLGQAELRLALERSRSDVEACLHQRPAGRPLTLRARVRLDRAHRMSISIGLRPRDPVIEACAETAIRRFVQPLQSRSIRSDATATLVVRSERAIPPPAPAPPPPPAHDSEAQVHAALNAIRASLIECVSDLSPATPGQMTLRLALHVDGSMTLVGVNLPSGVRGPGSLGCLSSRVAWLRVSPPMGERVIVHDVHLGR